MIPIEKTLEMNYLDLLLTNSQKTPCIVRNKKEANEKIINYGYDSYEEIRKTNVKFDKIKIKLGTEKLTAETKKEAEELLNEYEISLDRLEDAGNKMRDAELNNTTGNRTSFKIYTAIGDNYFFEAKKALAVEKYLAYTLNNGGNGNRI